MESVQETRHELDVEHGPRNGNQTSSGDDARSEQLAAAASDSPDPDATPFRVGVDSAGLVGQLVRVPLRYGFKETRHGRCELVAPVVGVGRVGGVETALVAVDDGEISVPTAELVLAATDRRPASWRRIDEVMRRAQAEGRPIPVAGGNCHDGGPAVYDATRADLVGAMMREWDTKAAPGTICPASWRPLVGERVEIARRFAAEARIGSLEADRVGVVVAYQPPLAPESSMVAVVRVGGGRVGGLRVNVPVSELAPKATGEAPPGVSELEGLRRENAQLREALADVGAIADELERETENMIAALVAVGARTGRPA